MSTWVEIKNQEDVELSDDGKTIEVLYSSDQHGNNYIDIPVEFIKSVLTPDSSGEDYQDDSDSWSGGFAENH